jgi:hypothetical protein
MNAKAEKAERERRVFQDFIQKSGLPISPESVESRECPEPDILCVHESEGRIAFELVEICDPHIAKTLSALGKTGGVGFIRGTDTTSEQLQKKFTKPYKSEYPIELLCYQAGRTISPDAVIRDAIRQVISSMNNGKFRRIWLLGDKCDLVWPDRGLNQ